MADPSAGLPGPPAATPQYQSLYRRFRPQRFADVRGQEHVTRALLNTVRDERVAHAYLFSGPRGTGKTSTARILAMALNCEHPVAGEPDGTCASCVDIRLGASVDVTELDAASNRGINEMRDLRSRVAMGTRGRWRVYIIDEVHQLTADAAGALLKTLEEPPAHVVFVLATTDPQKVLPTIRSRTIPFEFHLLPSEVLGDLLRDINEQAGLGVAPEAIDIVIRRGHGSARDALTVLDQVAAGGGVEDQAQVVSQIVDGLAERDAGLVLTAVAEGMASGRDARRLAAELVEHLRNGFLATMARSLVMLPDDAVTEVAEQARRLGLAALVRAMEIIGQALADMRDSVDPRVTLEVALVRLSRPDADVSPAALLERIERLERARPGENMASSASVAPRPVERVTPPAPRSMASPPLPIPPKRPPPAAAGPVPPAAPPPPPPLAAAAPPAAPPRAPSAPRPPAPSGPRPTAAAGASVPPRPAATPGSAEPGTPLPTRDELTLAWGDGVLRGLSGKAKAYLGSGRFVGVDPDAAVYAVPNPLWLSRSLDVRAEAEAALAARFGRRVPLKMVVEAAIPSAAAPADSDKGTEELDRAELDHLQDADVAVISPEQRLMDAFPGAEEVST
ncbi:MAG: polymerase subunit gamma/tau [Acidimicrobiaceae bacterium]|nr:polymerase subunit gamma/tau [Acidimicrobiaceae bacterium]